MAKDQIMTRMKDNYEGRARSFLTRRTPVIIRIDGKAFHTYTKDCGKPFDEELMDAMQQTAIYLCENIQGAKCAYTQSDEISLLLTDYDDLNTQAWFDYAVQKMTSISASMATARFNQLRMITFAFHNELEIGTHVNNLITTDEYMHMDNIEEFRLGMFDSRVFNIPKEEVANYFIARQNDAVKNSISMLAQSLYSHKELHGKNTSEMQEMCFQKGHNWNDLSFAKKRGSFILKEEYEVDNTYQPREREIENTSLRTRWVTTETPMKFHNDHFQQWLQ